MSTVKEEEHAVKADKGDAALEARDEQKLNAEKARLSKEAAAVDMN